MGKVISYIFITIGALIPTTNSGHIKKRVFLENERYLQASYIRHSAGYRQKALKVAVQI